MLRLAANISYLFTELPLIDRIGAAAEVGFKGVEILTPYEYSTKEIKSKLDEFDVECVLINTPYGEIAGGHTGLGAIEGKEGDFYDDINKTLDYAQEIGCTKVHVLAGVPEKNANMVKCREIFISNLCVMAELAASADSTVLIEPLNTIDFPGYFLTHQDQAHSIVKDVGLDNVLVQMDFYHCQIMEGNLVINFNSHIDNIGHIQLAGVPGRTEPNKGEINYPYLLQLIDASSYSGWVGAEYSPERSTLSGLNWARPYGINK